MKLIVSALLMVIATAAQAQTYTSVLDLSNNTVTTISPSGTVTTRELYRPRSSPSRAVSVGYQPTGRFGYRPTGTFGYTPTGLGGYRPMGASGYAPLGR